MKTYQKTLFSRCLYLFCPVLLITIHAHSVSADSPKMTLRIDSKKALQSVLYCQRSVWQLKSLTVE